MPTRRFFAAALIAALALHALPALFAANPSSQPGDSHGAGHHDPVVPILLTLAALFVAAAVGRNLALRFGQPAVLGELTIGIIVGNVGFWLAHPMFTMIMHLNYTQKLLGEVFASGSAILDAAAHVFSPEELAAGAAGAQVLAAIQGPGGAGFLPIVETIWLFSSLGVILLLFMVGLESTVADMMAVGPRATAVAVLGVVCPFAIGYLASLLLLPAAPMTTHLFLGATLTATSVGITARVFRDLSMLQSPTARIVLGAAVIDDVLGLIVLAVVAGIVTSGGLQLGELGRIVGVSIVFIGVVLMFGERLVILLVSAYRRLDPHHYHFFFPLALAFVLSWIAAGLGLAAIVGAFAAGLMINPHRIDPRPDGVTIERLIAPLEQLFAPMFFLLVGMQVNLATFADPTTLYLGIAFTVAAIVGKIVSGLAAGPNANRLAIGVGMIPRGEVGLIFASVGKALGVVSGGVFSAVVIMVVVTTLITPPALGVVLARARRQAGATAAE